MKVAGEVIAKHIKICPKSTEKCNSFRDIEDKIIRAVHLGGGIKSRTKGHKYFMYYDICFVVKGHYVVDMFKDKENFWHVEEKAKRKFDKKYQKIKV